jgi:hypothetical protein
VDRDAAGEWLERDEWVAHRHLAAQLDEGRARDQLGGASARRQWDDRIAPRRRGQRRGDRRVLDGPALRVAERRGDRGDARQLAELDAAARVGRELGHEDRARPAMHEVDRHGPLRARLAGLAERGQHPAGRRPRQVECLDREAGVHARDVERALIGELLLVLFADHVDEPVDADREPGGHVAQRPLEDGGPVIGQHERLRLRGRHALAIGQRDVPGRALQELERGRHARRRQLQPRERADGPARDQRLAIEREAELQRIALALEIEELDGRDVAVEQQHRGAARRRRERHHEGPAEIGRVLAIADPRPRLRDRATRLVYDGHDVPRGADPRDVAQPALVDHRAARDAVADQIDDVGAGARAHRQLEQLAVTHDRGLCERQHHLVARREPVEIEIRRDLAVVVLEVGQRIDPEHLHHELGDVLDVHRERDRLAGREAHRVVRAQRELDAIAEHGGARGSQRERRAIGLGGGAVEQRRGRELAIEPLAIEPAGAALGERAVGVEQLAHERLVVAGRRQPGQLAVVAADLRELGARDPLEPRARRIGGRARQLQVRLHRGLLDCRPARAGRIEQVPQHVRLERVRGGRQRGDELPERREVRRAGLAIELEVDLGGWSHAAHHRADPAVVGAQLGASRGERVQLIERQLAVDRERAEVAALGGEVLGHERDDLALRRVADAREQHAAAGRIERPAEQLVEALVGDLREVGVVVERLLQELGAVEQAVRQTTGARRCGLVDLGRVPVLDAEHVAHLIGDARGIGGEPVEQLAPARALVAVGRAVALGPGVQDRVGVVERAGVLRGETAEVVVVLAAGQQLRQAGAAVVREG